MLKTLRDRRWTGWSKRRPSLLQPFPALRVEELEARTVPATFTWTGAGADTNWSTGTNWLGGAPPLTNNAASNDTLVFPVTTGSHVSVNNISNTTFFSITINDSNYAISGKSLTLGTLAKSGNITVGANLTGSRIDLPIALGGAADDYQISVNSLSSFTVNGQISGNSVSTLLKDGLGTLTLTANNTGLSGNVATKANTGGTLAITNSGALGNVTGRTIVGVFTTLALNGVATTISEPLTLNGPGVGNLGAVRSIAGANTWSGAVIVDTDSTFGADTGTSVNFTGVISDSGSGCNVTKEGLGTVQFSAANTYRGTTTVNEGVLAISNAKSLGTADRTSATWTVVNQTLTKAGQLRIVSGAGITVLNERLRLHGDGGGTEDGTGSLLNFTGDNDWAGPVELGGGSSNTTSTTIGAADTTNLIISGVVEGTYNLLKVGTGRVILNNANTYTGATQINEGILNVRDSSALSTSTVTVADGATLQLEVEAATTTPQFGYDQVFGQNSGALARNLWKDSVTLDPNRLQFSNGITINGLGFSGSGALHSLSGINTWLSNVQLASTEAAIGVDPDGLGVRDGHPTPSSAYWTNDYSLTVVGQIIGGSGTDFVKRATGQLILPTANPYTGLTRLEQGWITIQNQNALGGRINGIGDTVQPATTVSSGAALHLKKLNAAAADLVVPENLTLTGTGITHPYAYIGGKGVVMNIGGNNTLTGDITLQGNSGFGVEQVEAALFSELTTTGTTKGGVVTFNTPSNGGSAEQVIMVDAGATSGTITVNYDMYSIPDRLTAYYPPRGFPGSTQIFDSGSVVNAGTFTIPYGPGTGTVVEIVMNEGGNPQPSVWDLSIVLQSGASGLEKYGSKRLRIQGDATFTGDVRVLEGTLSAENDTALGRNSSGTLTGQQVFSETPTAVDSGAVLELRPGLATNNGGISSGIEVFDERLTLNSYGYQLLVAGDPLSAQFTLTMGAFGTTASLSIAATAAQVQAAINALGGPVSAVSKTGSTFTIVFDTALADETSLTAAASGGGEVQLVDGQSSLINISEDNVWRGPIVLNAGTRFRTNNDSRFSALGVISDSGGGSQLVKRGNGELMLGGANSYRGTTLISEGIVTLMNSLALGLGDGSATAGTIVRTNAQLQLQGSLTVANETLTVGGTGPDSAAVPDAIPIRWLQVGAAPSNQGQTPGNTPVAGRVTGTVVDYSDPNVIYISTAGGGAWKTKDGGKTWQPLFDLGSATAPLHGGSIAIDSADPRIIYYATGESNNSSDSFAGTGIYRSTDSGKTWSRLLDTNAGALANPIAGQSVSKVIAMAGGRYIFAATSDGASNAYVAAAPGVWRYDLLTSSWFNLSAETSTNRATRKGTAAPFANVPPNTPGPDDDYRVSFRQTNVSWTDMAVVSGTLYAALLENPGTTNGGHNSGVFRLTNPTLNTATTKPIWQAGNGALDSRTDVFPMGPFDGNGNPTGNPRNGRISLAAAGANVWATIARPTQFGAATDGQFLEMQRSTTSGTAWAALTTPAGMANVLGASGLGQGNFNNTMVAANAQTLYVGGSSASHIWMGTGGGTTWTDISLNAAATSGPFAGNHAMAVTSNSANADLILGGDGGVYRYSPTTSAWEDINGTLAVTNYNDIAVNPVDFNSAAGGSQATGTAIFDGSTAWTRTDGEFGGDIYYDPTSPNILYHVQHYAERPNTSSPFTTIRKSTDSGATWNTVYIASTRQAIPLVLDQVNTNRLVTSNGAGIVESLDGLTTQYSIGGTYTGGAPRFLALGAYQGPWVDDPDFNSLVDLDRGSNAYDPSTLYASDGAGVHITKDNGLSWVARPLGVTDQTYTVNFNQGVLKYKNLPQITFSGVPTGAYVTARTAGDGVGSQAPFARQVDESQTIQVVYANGTPAGSFDATFNFPAVGTPYNLPAKNFTITINLGESAASVQNKINTALANAPNMQGDEYQALVVPAATLGATPSFQLTIGGIQTAAIAWSGQNGTTVAAINAAFVTATIGGVVAELHGGQIYLHYAGTANVALATVTVTNMDMFIREVQQGGSGRVAVGRTNGSGPQITSLTVDPANHDHVYVTGRYSNHANGPTVFRTTDAGQTWTDASGTGLPLIALNGTAATTAQPAWSFAIDPRDNTWYVGTDVGVYVSRNSGANWSQFGNGIPNVQVRDLELNLGLNTLSAGTYGRSMYQIFLDYSRADSGALRAVSGSSVWTGPVTLTANTRIETDGTQNIQNGIAAATLNITGEIMDPAGDFDIVKEGEGTLILSAANSYGGQTLVKNGILVVNNPNALGAFAPGATANTIVSDGAALELATDLYREPVELNGSGFQFNDHFTGSLRNNSGNNTYTGPLTLKTPLVTIGVNSGTQLTIGAVEGDTAFTNGLGSITDEGNNYAIDKELSGTLVFANANVYGGLTQVIQGALRVAHAGALGTPGNGTLVYDGAALQMSRNNVSRDSTIVTSEPLFLSGTGIFGSGAFRNVRGDSLSDGGGKNNDNTWQGPITLVQQNNFSPDTVAAQLVAFGTSDQRDTLFIDVSLVESAASYDINKVGAGRVTFVRDNGYTGTTNVLQGYLRIRTDLGLGLGAPGTIVSNGATLELDARNGTLNPAEDLLLFGDGVGTVGALNNVVDFDPTGNSYSGPITIGSTTAGAGIGADPGTTLTILGLLRDPVQSATPVANAAPGRFRKLGDGTVVLPDAKDYAGLTLVSEGILNIRAADALGRQHSDVQFIDVIATTGTFALTFKGQTTTALPFDATDVQVDAALEALSTIGGVGGTVDIVVIPGAGTTTYEITFGGTLQNTDQPNIEPIYVAPTAFATTRNGTATLAEIQTVYVSAVGGAGINFGLVFNGARTTAIPVNATAAVVRAALIALPTIGGVGGSVNVVRSGTADDYTYTITFAGSLATGNQNPLQSVVVGGTRVTQSSNTDGQLGTTVASGATLQVDGGLTFTFPVAGEIITLNGQGVLDGSGNRLGALNVLNGDTTFNVPLLLGSDASVGVTNSAADKLIINSLISQDDPTDTDDLDIYGPGTVIYNGDGTGTYSGTSYTGYVGTTTVHSGMLRLNVTTRPGILGPLVVGDAVGAAGSAIVIELLPDQVANGSTVRVNSDGIFDLNGLMDTVGNLTMVGGDTFTRNGGKLTTGTITMSSAAEIFVGNNASLTGLDTTMVNSDIHVGTNSSVSLGSLTMDASHIDYAPAGPGTLTLTGTLTMTNGSTITLPNGPGTTFNGVDIILDNSTIDSGNAVTITARNVTLTNAAHIDFDDTGKFTATGAVSVSSGSDITFDLNGRFDITGNLTLNNGKISLGAATAPNTTLPTTATLTANQISMTGGTSEISIGNFGYLTAAGKVTNAAGDILFGTNGTFSAGGTVALSADALVNFGTNGKFNNQPFDLTLDNSDFKMADGGTAKTRNIALSTDALIQFANNGTLQSSGNTTMTGASDITFLNGGSATTGTVDITGGTISFQDTGTLQTANVTNIGAAISFGNTGKFTAGSVGVLGGTIAFGATPAASYPYVAGGINGVFSATGSLSLDASAFSMGDGGTATSFGLLLTNASKISFNDNGTFTDNGTLTTTASDIVFGNIGKLTSGDLTQTGGMISFQNGGTLDPANVVNSGGKITFLDAGTFTPDNVNATNAVISFQNGGTMNTRLNGTGDVTLSKTTTLSFGDGANVDLRVLSTSGTVTIALGNNGTLDTTTANLGNGSSPATVLTFGNDNTFTAKGNVTFSTATGTFGTDNKLDVTGNLNLTSATLAYGTTGTVLVSGDVGLATNSKITFADAGKLDVVGNATLTGSSKLVYANDGRFKMNNLQITTGSIAMGTNGKVLGAGTGSIVGASVTLGNGGTFDFAGDVSIAVGASAGSLTVGTGSLVESAKLTVTGSNVSIGAGSTANTSDVTVTGNSTITVDDGSTFNAGNVTSTTGKWVFKNSTTLNSTGNVSLTASSMGFGNFGKLDADGNVTITNLPSNPAVSFGTDGQLFADGDLSLNNALLGFGVNGKVSVEDVSITNKSKLTFAINGTLIANGAANDFKGDIGLNNGTLKFNNTGSLIGGDVTEVNSKIEGGTNITYSIRKLDMDPSTFSLGSGATGTITGDVDIVDGFITHGDNSHVTVGGHLDSESAAITFGNGGSLAVTGFVVVDHGVVNLGGNFAFSAADVTLTDNTFSQGNVGTFTAADLTLTDAYLNLGTNIAGSIQDLGLFNSTILLGTATSMGIAGDIAANSGGSGTASIIGGGSINLGNGIHGAAVGNGDIVDDVDFVISTEIASSATARLNKTGVGRMELAAPSGAIVDVNIAAGDVQVSTSAGDVQLTGGTLSGLGEVGTLTGASGGQAVGLVSPGNGWDIDTTGILTSGNAVWGPQTTFHVDLSHTAGGPTPGTDYDQLVVNGDIDLGNALLTAKYGPGIVLNDSFTIVAATGNVTGKFQQFNSQDIIFVLGQKFAIEYTGNSVVLNKVRANATVTITTNAPNPSTLNQPITLIATVVPELGAELFTHTITTTFYDNGNAISTQFVDKIGSQFFATVNGFTSLSVGNHVLTATFNGDADNFNPSTTQAPQVEQLVQQPYAEALTDDPEFLSPNNGSSIGINDSYTISTLVKDERGDITWTFDIRNSGNAIVRTLSGSGTPGTGTEIPISNTWDGKNSANGFVADGLYTVTLTVNDSFGNTYTVAPESLTVDNTSPTAVLQTPSQPAIDPTASSVLPSSTVLSGTVADTNLSNWVVSIRNQGGTLLRSFSGIGTSVNATWNGLYDPLDATDPVSPTTAAPDAAYTITITATDLAGNNTTSSSQTVVVLANGPTVTLTSNTPTVYGQNFTLTAAVTLPTGSPLSLINLLNGDTVQFFRGALQVGSGPLTFNGSTGKYEVSVTLPTLNAGTYSNFSATYVVADFPASTSAFATHVITPAPLTITAQNKTRTYGAANPAFTFLTSGLVNGDTVSVLTGSLATAATVTTGVGTYPITQGTLAPNGNYTISTFNNGTLTITPAGLSIRIDDKTRPVNTPNPLFTFTITGLLNGDPASVVSSLPLGTTAVISSPVGSYPITQTGPLVVNPNYVVPPSAITNGTLAVTPVLTNFAVGAGASINPTDPSRVNVYSPSGTLIRSFTPFGSFPGGIRTAVADFNGDGVQDVAVATGPGAIAQLSVFDGTTGASILNVLPFEQFTGGLFVAAGDIDADGIAEVVLTPDEGGGPRVLVYQGGSFTPFLSYFGINDPNFRGGARAGVGDMNGDGYAEVVVSAGFQGGPRISIWDGKSLTAAQFRNTTPDFFAFDPSLRNGAFVAIGDVNGDGFGDLIAGAGPGGAPHVKIFSGKDMINPAIGPSNTAPFASFFAGDPVNRGGVRVAAKVFDNDLYVDLLTGAGDRGGDTSTAYLGKDLKDGVVDDFFSLDFPGLNNNGVFVG